jgi:sugar lactone lactonase YvrE
MLGRVVYVLEGEDAVVYADLRHLARFPLNDTIVAADGTAEGRRRRPCHPGRDLPRADGAVWAADPIGRRVLRVLPDGAIDRVIPIDDGHPLACVLGGFDRRTLFTAIGAATTKNDRPPDARGRLVALEVEVAGAGRP